MPIAAMMGMMDDAARSLLRLFGLAKGPSNPQFNSPQDLVNGLRNPATEEAAVGSMRRMGYGAFYGQKSRGAFSGLAEGELLRKGKGMSGLLSGRPLKGLSVGLSHLHDAAIFAPLQAIASAYVSKPGHKMSGMVGGASRAIAFGAGDLVGTLIGGPLAGIALGMVTEHVGTYVEDSVQFFHDFNKMTKHINMGGNYEDTQTAYTMRQRAAQEMGSSVLNARQWLGKESALMHQ